MTEFQKIANIGGGVIGSSFSIIFARGGLNVTNISRNDDGVKRTQTKIETMLDQLLEKDVIDAEEKEDILSRISYSTDMEEVLKDVDYVQENWPETMEKKREVVELFEKYAPDDAVLASSTSGLLVSEIAKNAKHPERILGVHPYNPPHIIPLIEIIKGEKTDEALPEKVKTFFSDLGKIPVVLNKEVPGYIANRLQAAVFRESIDLVVNGVATMEDVDKALTFGPGIRWGIMGSALNFELASDKGLEGMVDVIGKSMLTWLDDMATWTEFPDDMSKVYEGVDEAIENRPKEIGDNREDLNDYRTSMLIDILKLHNLM
ncbi:MAG: 3-hydroxyacyl-CoA dehydrogenase NAD-binding domain-containing protein [Firmicutes bacterium]|nr:3-hydroxyacyl-CoA dehydrogenase NAD-binding domain-containing protein [Bacillota bacterium]